VPDMHKSLPSSRGLGPHVTVIGGGATGCGVARDLCMRGFSVTLLEFGDLGSGTSGRFHGMLQSGARYAVSDAKYAAECMRERRIVAAITPQIVEETGGLFVSLTEDPPDFAEQFLLGCQAAAIPVIELDPADVTRQEPAISCHITRAFSIPDATIHPWRLVNLLAEDVRRHGGALLTRHRAEKIEMRGGRVCAVHYVAADGTLGRLDTDAVVNAAGPWAARVAALAGGGVDLALTKGSILVVGHRLVQRAVNRCRPPTSHDIIVPTGTVSLFGTTSEVVDNPDSTTVSAKEIQELLSGAEPLIPDIRSHRILRAWAGVRPLVKPAIWSNDGPLPRRHAVIDHAALGAEGFFTVCGGSLTTHRQMAEDVVDHVCRRFGVNQPCRTATTPLRSTGVGQSLDAPATMGWRPAADHEWTERNQSSRDLICECEAVERKAIVALLQDPGLRHMHDLRRRLRVGFGPCQGSFCGGRLAELLAETDSQFPVQPQLWRFWTERLKGAVRVAWGEQARQVLLSDTIYRGTLGLRLDSQVLPAEDRR